MNMYVSNLGFHVTGDDLRTLFSGFGEVTSANVITDKVTGRSRGFGFVEMPQDEAAEQAMQKLDGKEIEGRMIAISRAKPRSDNKSGGSFGGNRNSRW